MKYDGASPVRQWYVSCRSGSAPRLDGDGKGVAGGREGADEVVGEGARRQQGAVEVDRHAAVLGRRRGPQEAEAKAAYPAGGVGEDRPERAVLLDRDLSTVTWRVCSVPSASKAISPPRPSPRSTPSAFSTRTERVASYGRKVPVSAQRASYGVASMARKVFRAAESGSSPVPPRALRGSARPAAARRVRRGRSRPRRDPR